MKISANTRANILILSQALGFFVWGEFFKHLNTPSDAYLLRYLVIATSLITATYFFWKKPTQLVRDRLTHIVILLANLQVAFSIPLIEGHYVGLMGGMIVIAATLTLVRGMRMGVLLILFWLVAIPIIIHLTPALKHPLLFAVCYLTSLVVGLLAFVDHNEVIRERDVTMELSRLVIDNMSEGVLLFSSSQKTLVSNPAIERILKTKKQILKEQKISEFEKNLLWPDGTPLSTEEYPSVVVSQNLNPIRNAHHIITHPGESALDVLINATPLRLSSSDVFVLVTIQDITEREADLRELEKKKESLNQSAKMISLGEMAAGIAHEINNPLAVLSGRVDLLEMKMGANEDTLKVIMTLKKSIQRIDKIIQSMRLLSGNPVLEKLENYQISTIVKNVLELSLFKMEEESIVFSLVIDQDFSVPGKKSDFARIIMSVLQNAIQSQKGKVEPWIKMRIFESNGAKVLRISNKGEIAENIREKMGQPFFTSRDVGEGTGLGLSTSIAMMRSYGGSLTFDCNDGETSFDLRWDL